MIFYQITVTICLLIGRGKQPGLSTKTANTQNYPSQGSSIFSMDKKRQNYKRSPQKPIQLKINIQQSTNIHSLKPRIGIVHNIQLRRRGPWLPNPTPAILAIALAIDVHGVVAVHLAAHHAAFVGFFFFLLLGYLGDVLGFIFFLRLLGDGLLCVWMLGAWLLFLLAFEIAHEAFHQIGHLLTRRVTQINRILLKHALYLPLHILTLPSILRQILPHKPNLLAQPRQLPPKPPLLQFPGRQNFPQLLALALKLLDLGGEGRWVERGFDQLVLGVEGLQVEEEVGAGQEGGGWVWEGKGELYAEDQGLVGFGWGERCVLGQNLLQYLYISHYLLVEHTKEHKSEPHKNQQAPKNQLPHLPHLRKSPQMSPNLKINKYNPIHFVLQIYKKISEKQRKLICLAFSLLGDAKGKFLCGEALIYSLIGRRGLFIIDKIGKNMKVNPSWSIEEDQLLCRLVKGGGQRCGWTEVAQKMNEKFVDKTRFGKQCRDRFVNHLRLSSSQESINSWTRQQTQYLFDLYKQLGSRWTEISNRLPGKTENCVKNKFYGGLRKTVRSLNMLYRSACHKSKKEIKFKSIMRIFEYAEGRYRHQTALFQESVQLRDFLLGQAVNQAVELEQERVTELMNSINQFSIAIRSFKTVKKGHKGIGVKTGPYAMPQARMGELGTSLDAPKSESSPEPTQQSMQLSGSISKQNLPQIVETSSQPRQNHSRQPNTVVESNQFQYFLPAESEPQQLPWQLEQFFEALHSPLCMDQLF